MSAMTETKKGMVSVQTAADIIGCSTAHVRRLLASEIIAGEQLDGSGYWLVYRDSAEEFAKTQPKVGRPRGR